MKSEIKLILEPFDKLIQKRLADMNYVAPELHNVCYFEIINLMREELNIYSEKIWKEAQIHLFNELEKIAESKKK